MPGFIKKLTTLPKEKQKPELESALRGSLHQLVESDEFYVVTSSTNATDWKVTGYKIKSASIDTHAKEIDVILAYVATGVQQPGKPAFGTKIEGEAKAILDDDGKVNYDDVTADLVD